MISPEAIHGKEKRSIPYGRRLSLTVRLAEQYRVRRHWFIRACKSAAERFAAREIIIRFWKEKKETEDIWLNNAMMRVRVKICRQLNALLQCYNLSFRFVEELVQAMEDAAETNLIEGIVPYDLCFRRARIKGLPSLV